MTEKQPQVRSTVEALRLANYFDYHGFFDSDMKAAAELRRLHAETTNQQDWLVEWRKCEDELKRLHEVNQELLGALKTYGAHSSNCDHLILLTSMPPQRKQCSCGLHAAIEKAGEQP